MRWVRPCLWVAIMSLLVTSTTALYLRQDPSEVTVDDALSRFRESTPDAGPAGAAPEPGAAPTTAPAVGSAPPAGGGAAGAATTAPGAVSSQAGAAGSSSGATRPGAATTNAPTMPAPDGVYVYATQGYESTNALGGARHDYPAETPATMRRASCGGYTFRWEPLRERWDDSELCPDGDATSIRRFSTYHEFYQRGQQQDFTCPSTSHVYRPNAPAGSTWTWQCTARDSAIDSKVTVIGIESVTVQGKEVRTSRVLYESKMTGANRGTQRQERWLDVSTGMNVRVKTDIDAEVDAPFGTFHYEEHYTITLTSMTPRR